MAGNTIALMTVLRTATPASRRLISGHFENSGIRPKQNSLKGHGLNARLQAARAEQPETGQHQQDQDRIEPQCHDFT